MIHLKDTIFTFMFFVLMAGSTVVLADASQTVSRSSSATNPQSELIANNPALVNPKDPTGVRSNTPGVRPSSSTPQDRSGINNQSTPSGVSQSSPTGVSPTSPTGVSPTTPAGTSPSSPTGVHPSGVNPSSGPSGLGSDTSGY